MKVPEIKVDTKIVVALALISLAVSYVVYMENRRLKNAMNAAITPIAKRPCNCKDKDVSNIARASAQMAEQVPPTVVIDD